MSISCLLEELKIMSILILQEEMKKMMEDFHKRLEDVNTKTELPTPTQLYKIIISLYDEDEDIKGLIEEFHKKKLRAIIETYPEEMREKSITNYADFYHLEENQVNINDVLHSSEGIRGWAEDYGEGVIV